jgi:hypothetical protein
MPQKRYFKWKELKKWNETSGQKWSDVSVLIEVNNIVAGSGGYVAYGNPGQRLQKDIGDTKTKRFLELYCKFKGIEYQEKREINENIKVLGSDFEIFIKQGIKEGIKINIGFSNNIRK